MVDFAALLDKPMDDIKKPKGLPEGSYVFGISDFEFAEAGIKKTPKVVFSVVPQEAMPDVDEEALAECLDGNPVSSKATKLDFFITGDAMWRLKEFLKDKLGIAATTLMEGITQSKGASFIGGVKHQVNPKDPTMPYSQIETTAKYEQ